MRETEMLKLALEDSDAATRAEVLALYATAEFTAEFCAFYASPEALQSAVNSVQTFECKAGPPLTWAQRARSGGSVTGGVIYCRAPVDADEFTLLMECLAAGATQVWSEWLGAEATPTQNHPPDASPPDSHIPTSRVKVGVCEQCGRDLRVKKAGIHKQMTLTCKCGAMNLITVSDAVMADIPVRTKPARHYTLVFDEPGGTVVGTWIPFVMNPLGLTDWLLSAYRDQKLAEDKWRLIPAVETGQYRCVENKYDDSGGFFVMFGGAPAPGEPGGGPVA